LIERFKEVVGGDASVCWYYESRKERAIERERESKTTIITNIVKGHD
jgi:hypothetical protein